MITKVGYICKTFKLTEEEQREALEKRIDKNIYSLLIPLITVFINPS